MDVRRVVTGHDPAGRAVFVSDEPVAALELSLFPEWAFHTIWGADTTPAFPDDGTLGPMAAYFPPAGGFRILLSTIPPADAPPPPEDLDLSAATAEAEAALPGLLATMEPDHPGMHTSATLDVELILQGEAILELDDGAERHLREGDMVVQNGTRHRWSNPGAVPTVMLVVMIGALRR